VEEQAIGDPDQFLLAAAEVAEINPDTVTADKAPHRLQI
jgi:hypothetical protein